MKGKHGSVMTDEAANLSLVSAMPMDFASVGLHPVVSPQAPHVAL
jgi:hypothetical protein